MSAYITRKVADRLVSEFNNHREDYQRYWDDIHPFVKYGCIRDEKFYDRVKKALLFKTTADEYLTLEEYRSRNCDGEECTVYYASDAKRQAQMIKLYTCLLYTSTARPRNPRTGTDGVAFRRSGRALPVRAGNLRRIDRCVRWFARSWAYSRPQKGIRAPGRLLHGIRAERSGRPSSVAAPRNWKRNDPARGGFHIGLRAGRQPVHL